MPNDSDYPAFPKRKQGLSVRALSGESIVYDPATKRASCLNDFAAAVLERCDGQRSPAEIARDLPFAAVDERVVTLTLADLRKARLLEHGSAVDTAPIGTSRREFFKRIGLGTAVTVPAVSSVILPSAAQTVSCSGICSSNAECPPGCVCIAQPA